MCQLCDPPDSPYHKDSPYHIGNGYIRHPALPPHIFTFLKHNGHLVYHDGEQWYDIVIRQDGGPLPEGDLSYVHPVRAETETTKET